MEYQKFTGEQTRKIDEMLKNNFENATAEDIELYATWKAERVKREIDFETKKEEMKNDYEMQKAILEKQSESAENALNDLVAGIFNRLKVVENGQEK